MTLKTYRGSTMAEALAAVKKELGPAAVILHTRTYKVGGLAGVCGRTVFEITASPDAHAGARRAGVARRPAPPRQAVPARPSTPPARHDERAFERWSELRDQRSAPPARGSLHAELKPTGPLPSFDRPEADSPSPHRRQVLVPVDDHERQDAPHPQPEAVAAGRDRSPAPAQRLATLAPLAPVDERASLTLQDELAAIKRLMGQVLQTSRQAVGRAPTAPGSLPDALFELSLRLSEQEVPADLADDLLGRVRDALRGDELRDERTVAAALLREVARRIPTAPDRPREDGPRRRPRTIALIGPTGVGKTTTLAKLAATYKLRRGLRVGLVTCDTYRIAAVEQLRTYANIIALPLKVAMTPSEMVTACESLAECDVVLVDTPGRSQHDAQRLDELQRLIDAASPDERHLVLSCTAETRVLSRIAERFGALRPTRIIVSKLDEGVVFGPLLGIVARLGVPLSYVTTGQEVPDHIEPADADRLARLVLDGPRGAVCEPTPEPALAS